MATHRWMNCELDDAALQNLQDWKSELMEMEQEVVALEQTLRTQIANFTGTTKTASSLTIGDTGAGEHRLIIRAKEPGTSLENWTIQFVNPGANFEYDLFDPSTWNLRIRPETYSGTLTDELEQSLREQNILWVEVTTDIYGANVSGPKYLAEQLTAAGYDEIFEFEYPDYYETLLWGWLVVPVDLPFAVPTGPLNLSGGIDTPLVDLTASINKVYSGTGKDTETVLETVGVPVVKSGATPAEVLQQISNVLVLQSGKTLEVLTEDNLTVLRQLWTLLGADSDASTTLNEYLPGTTQTPLVIWTEEVSTDIEVSACEGQEGTITQTVTQLASINSKPTSGEGLTWHVFWRDAITPTSETLGLLGYYGVASDEISDALDADYENTYVIPDSGLLSDLSLTTAETTELMGLEVTGVGAIDLLDAIAALNDLTPSAATGFISPSFNVPTGSPASGGVDLRNELSPESSMTEDLLAFSETKCIDPLAKLGITSFFAAASALVDTVARILERVRGTVAEAMNAVSGLLANIQEILSKADAIACLMGLDMSFKAPSISLMKPQIELFAFSFKGILDTVQEIFDLIFPKLCSVQEAINSLLGPALGAAECLIPGITNAIANAFGAALDDLLDQLPCIENPFDIVGMIQELQLKIDGLAEMAVSMLNDVLAITSQLSISIGAAEDSALDEATGGCSSGPLAMMVSTVKSKLGV